MGGSSRQLAVFAAIVLALARSAQGEAYPGSVTSKESAPPVQVSTQHVDLAALPGINFATDTGFGVGLTAAMYVRENGYQPYKYALRLGLFATTRGIQDHSLSFDAPNFLGTTFRPNITVGFFRDKFRPFYGIGNTVPQTIPAGSTLNHFFTYSLSSFFVTVSIEKKLAPHWKGNLVYDLRSLGMDVRPGSLLAMEQPTGTDGGASGRADLELIFDSRDQEASPIHGIYAGVSGHLAGPWLLGHFVNSGVAAEWHGYYSPGKLGSKLVLAGRLMGDVTWGDVPVAMLPVFGGRTRIEGLGGSVSIRGLPRFRYVGQAKALANVELRSQFYSFTLFHRPLDLWAVGFVDAGRVWATVAPDGPPFTIHTSRGIGLRAAFVRDFVVRFDLGFSEGSTEFYTSLDQMF